MRYHTLARDLQPEWMDQPDLQKEMHDRALSGLARINWWSASAGILWPAIRNLAKSRAAPLRILDLATGGGDVPLRLWRKARAAGVKVDICGCDCSATAIEFARRRAELFAAEIRFFAVDLLRDELPGDFDILTSSLFLHHLEENQAVAFLGRAGRAARRLLLINDLRRSWWGLQLAKAATRLMTRSPVVRRDGPSSVRAAFTIAEARELARRAGLRRVEIAPKWPFRFLLSFRR